MSVTIALLAGVVALEYLVIALFVVPRLARLADGRGSRVLVLAQIGAAAFFLGCAATHITVVVQALRGDAGSTAMVHLAPHLLQVVGGGIFIWAVSTRRLSVQLLERHGIDAESARTRLAAIVRHSRDAIYTKDARGRITSWNAAATRLYGYTSDEAIGQSVALIVPPHRAGEESTILHRVLDGETIEHYETERRRKDGSIVKMSLTVSPLHGSRSAPQGASVIGRDITEQSRIAQREAILAESVPRLSASLEVASTAQALAHLVVPRLGTWCAVDMLQRSGGLQRLGATAVDADVERALWDAATRDAGWPPADVLAVLASAQARKGDDGASAVIPFAGRRGAIGCLSVGFDRPATPEDMALLDELAGRAAASLENARLYREGEAARASAEIARAELEREQVRFRVAFQEAPIGVALVSMRPDSRGRFLQVNRALTQITGLSRSELERRSFMSLTHPDDRDLDTDALDQMIAGTATELSVEKRYLHASGHPIWVQVQAKLVSSDAGEPLYCVSHFQDVTDRKRYEGQLQHLADHDALTGLYNRRRLEQELARASQYVERYDEPASLLVVDLDNFKYYNDTYGHAVGDDVITLTAGVLQQQSRATDVVARLGGDEFAVILPHTDPAGAETFARHLLEALRRNPLTTAGERPIYITASIGVTPIIATDARTAAELLTEADVAMYDAKDAGRDRICHVDPQADRSGRIRARLSWSQRIREALDNDRFELWEQPIATVATGALQRTEILLRMLGDDDEPIPPSVFLYIAEHFGQIQAIDRWVVDHAIELLAQRQADGQDTYLEVNLSGATITDSDVIDFIVDRVQTAAIDPRRLTFEVTETAAIVNIERARQFARRLADLGCQFALDDFGAGFGSFYYLKHLPFDLVKIDGDFIKHLPHSKTDQLTVQAIVQITRGLGKQTVAEFVGDEETMALLAEYGVDFAQGYHIGVPRRVRPQAPRSSAVR